MRGWETRRSWGSRAAALWLGFIWLLPGVGPVLYIALGVNRIRRHALDGDSLATSGRPTGDGDGPARHPHPLGDEAHQLCVRGALHRRCGDLDFDGVAVPPGHLGPAGAWYHVHHERRHQPTTMVSSSRSSTHSASQAASGLQSSPPVGGSTRRIGSTTQSVKAYAGRSHRE